MNLYIAGLPNSGTTYVAHLLQAAGLNFGSVYWPNPKLRRKGMEPESVRAWYLQMFLTEFGTAEPSEAMFTYSGRDAYIEQHPPPPPPENLKLPDFNVHRLHDHYKPETILKVVRPADGWVESMRVNRGTPENLARRLYSWVVERWPNGPEIRFPDCVFDRDYTVETLAPWADVTTAWQDLTVPKWVTA